MGVKVDIPEEFYRRASEVAAAEGLSVDVLFAAVFEQRLLELERLQAKAARGSYQKFQRVMAKVPAVEPSEEDRIKSMLVCRDDAKGTDHTEPASCC